MIAHRPLHSPESGKPLAPDSPHSLFDGVTRWPVVDGIPYLRVGRRELCAKVIRLLDDGRRADAAVALLAERDDWDRNESPAPSALERLVHDVRNMTYRAALDALNLGGVAVYFAHRWSDPTFVAGLAALSAFPPAPGARSFEIACGSGQYLAALRCAGIAADGGDIVFAKLWLARHFVAPDARLACFDAAAPWPIPTGAYDLVHAHDALYFFAHKDRVAAEMRRVAVPGATLIVTHAHNAAVDNFSAGEPLDVAGYRALLGDGSWYDDRELTAALVSARAPSPANDAALAASPAISWVRSSDGDAPYACDGQPAVPPYGSELVRNPLYDRDGRVRWPSERYAAEYGALVTYPSQTAAPLRAIMNGDPAIAAFARRRELVALPERW